MCEKECGIHQYYIENIFDFNIVSCQMSRTLKLSINVLFYTKLTLRNTAILEKLIDPVFNHEILHILRKPTVHYRAHGNPLLVFTPI